MYKHTGGDYEVARYGDSYKELYRSMRNETLGSIIENEFNNTNSVRILELGCGTGLTLSYLSALPSNYELHGLDFSDIMLSQANQKLKVSNTPFVLVQGDVFSLPFPDGVFDIVYSTRFIHQFEHSSKKEIYNEIRRTLRPGGLIITEFYTPHNKAFLSLRGLKKYPTKTQCPSYSEVSDITSGRFKNNPVRMIGMSAITKIFGVKMLKHLTAMTANPVFSFLREEYFVVTKKT